jgi:hypothetical protein
LAKKNLLNELPPDGALDKYLPQLFQTYPRLTASSPSAWFMWSDDGKKNKFQHATICHGNMSYEEPGYDHLVTAVPKSDELDLAYQRMIINGPFKSLSDLISLEQVDNRWYIRCSNLAKWPANALYNYCIATRLPIEFGQMLPRWAELTEKGYNSTLAFLLSYSTNGKAWDKENGRSWPSNGHLWLDPSSNWARIIQGDMKDVSTSFKEDPKATRPCNVIWGTSKNYDKFSWLTDEEISAFFELPIEVPEPPPAPKKKAQVDKLLAQQHLQNLALQIHNQAPLAQPNQLQGNPLQPHPGWGNPAAWDVPQHVLNIVHDEIQVNPDEDDDNDDDLDHFDDWGPEPEVDDDV